MITYLYILEKNWQTKTSMISLQYLLFCAGSFSTLQSGLSLGWSSYALPQLMQNGSSIPLTNNEGSWVASSFLIGTIFGSLLTGFTIDVFGRRTMLLVTSLPLFGMWLLIAYAKTSWDLYLARFIAGVADGFLLPCLPLYLGEVCNSKYRGFFISGTVVVVFTGTFLANLLGAFLSITVNAFISAILSLVPFILYLFVPESPQFYVINNKNDQARISLRKFNRNGDVDALFGSIRNTLIEQQANKKSWLELFADKVNCKTLTLMIALGVFHQFSGILGITFYIETLFEQASKNVNPIVLISVYYVLQIVTSVANAFLIDRAGRRPLLLTAMCLVTAGLICVTSYFVFEHVGLANLSTYSWLAVLGLLVFIIGYTVGLVVVPVVLCSELFSLDFKSRAVTIINVIVALIGAGVPKFFQYTKDKYGAYVPFLTFAICSACSIIFIYFYIPETKRKTLEEIQNDLRSRQALLSKSEHA
ncbi:hypothetical protein FQR65_LT01935 [Abscondita terminalis]|nr:hypothetical protein FQR65_LT01935 [Abscondita terminalis]